MEHGALCRPLDALCIEMVTEPVEAFFDAADEGFVGMLFQVELVQEPVQLRHSPAQLPAGSGQDQEIIHEVTGIPASMVSRNN